METRSIFLKKIEFEYFKHRDQSITLDLGSYQNQCSFVWAKNGCGKTTVFNAFAAFLNLDAKYFEKEKINNINVEYEINNGYQTRIFKGSYKIDVENSKIIGRDWAIMEEIIKNSKSIFVGGNRNFGGSSIALSYSQVYRYLSETNAKLSRNSTANELHEFTEYINRTIKNSFQNGIEEFVSQNHIYLDNVSPIFIENSIVTIFDQCADEYIADVLNSIFEKEESSIRQTEIENFIKFCDLYKYKIDLLHKVNDDNLYLENYRTLYHQYYKKRHSYNRIPRFLSKVNSYLNRKELVLKNGSVLVKFTDIDDTHDLSKLSNGELNLIALFLATELLVTEKIDLLFIDEISTSLDTDWLEKLVEDIIDNKLIGQVIIITHSPDITLNFNKACIKELKLNVNGKEV